MVELLPHIGTELSTFNIIQFAPDRTDYELESKFYMYECESICISDLGGVNDIAETFKNTHLTFK